MITDNGTGYVVVQKYTHKGRYGKDDQRVTVTVKARSEAELDDSAIEQKIEDS